jgi:TonB family protein
MNNPIQNVQLSFKCPMNWDEMAVAEGGRFCGGCQKKVYDFTGCSQIEYNAVIAAGNGEVCGRFNDHQMAAMPLPKIGWKAWFSGLLIFAGLEMMVAKVLEPAIKLNFQQNESNMVTTVLGIAMVEPTVTTFEEEFNFSHYPGGLPALRQFLNNNLHWPADVPPLQRKVIVGFKARKNGQLADFRIIKSSTYAQADTEALRAAKLMPRWLPQREKGKRVEKYYEVSIEHYLNLR